MVKHLNILQYWLLMLPIFVNNYEERSDNTDEIGRSVSSSIAISCQGPCTLTNAEKYKATKADTAEKEKNANLTLRNGLSISSRRRCLVVNPPNFSPRSASIGSENSGAALTLAIDIAEAGAVNDCATGTADATDSMKRRRFFMIMMSPRAASRSPGPDLYNSKFSHDNIRDLFGESSKYIILERYVSYRIQRKTESVDTVVVTIYIEALVKAKQAMCYSETSWPRFWLVRSFTKTTQEPIKKNYRAVGHPEDESEPCTRGTLL